MLSLLRILAVLLAVSMRVMVTEALHADEKTPPQDQILHSKLDGTEQRYVVMLPRDFRIDRPHDVIIALHGHGSDRWQFVNDPRDECRGARDAAAERNAIFVSPDYRAKTSWMGPAATSDMRQILDELQSQFRIRHVIISGGSMGGTSALAFAAMHPECVDAVVSLNGTANMMEYANFSEAIAESYGGSRQEKSDAYRQRSAELFPERLSMPIAATTGGKDTLVPPDSVLRLMADLKTHGASVLSIHHPDGGHDTNYDDTRTAFLFVFEALDAKEKASSTAVITDFDNASTIVCLGDSVTGVYYHTGGRRAYPEMLEIAIRTAHPNANVRVINAGISGHTTSNGLERLDTDVLRHKPTLVTISFGLNDMVRVPADQFRTNLEQLIDRCLSAGSRVMLCTPNAVIDTPDRPVSKLFEYCDIIRNVGREKNTPVCDQHATGERLKQRAPWTWRLTMSDAIHPNMDGHKRMAEELCRCVCGQEISLHAVSPPQPAISRTLHVLDGKMPLKVLAMEPIAAPLESAIRKAYPDAKIELTTWVTKGESLSQLEQEAKETVRTLKPDLVALTIPLEAPVANDEQLVHSISWIMNWSLSFGTQEWDCIVVQPSFDASGLSVEHTHRSELIRRLVHAQHLPLIESATPIQLKQTLDTWFTAEKNGLQK